GRVPSMWVTAYAAASLIFSRAFAGWSQRALVSLIAFLTAQVCMPGMIRLISSQAARSPLKKMVGMSYIPALKALIPASPIGVPLRVRDRMFLLLKVWAKAAPGVPFIACWPIIRKADRKSVV